MFGYYLDLAWRACLRGPAMVVLLVLTMAIGIASTMTAMTIFAALSGDPLPGISGKLYVVTMDARGVEARDTDPYVVPNSQLMQRDARALVDAHRAASQFAVAFAITTFASPDGQTSAQASGWLAYGPAMETLGVPLRFGRAWTHAEQAKHAPVVVIDANLAEQLFGKSNVIGRSVTLGSRQFRVVGVSAPWRPRLKMLGVEQDTIPDNSMFFVPVQAALDSGVGPFSTEGCPQGQAIISFQSTDVAQCRWMETWVQLDTPEAMAEYQRFVDRYAHAQHEVGRFVHAPHARLYRTRAWLDANHVVPDDVSLNLMLASAFLLLCMVNVAGLLAARFLRRGGSVAVRRALGASRRQVFIQHMVEASLLGLLGGLLALPLILFGLWLVRKQPVGYAEAAQFSGGTFLALLLLSLLVATLVGLLPAWRASTQPPALQIKLG